ncbi:MAG: DEAD/DEAH box helicase, partial [Kineosporiaceae bacterium]
MPGPRPSVRAARAALGRGQALLAMAHAVTEADRRVHADVEQAAEAARADAVRAALAATPVDQLSEVAARLPLRALERAGLHSVADVLDVPLDDSPAGLAARARTSPASASAVHGAAREYAAALAGRTPVRIADDREDTAATRLVVALHRYRRCAPALGKVATPARQLGSDLPPLLDAAARTGSRLRLLVAGARRRATAQETLARVAAVVDQADAGRLTARLDRAAAAAARPPASPRVAWRDYERKAAEYHTSVEEVLGAGRDLQAARGHLPEEVAAHVQLQELDGTHRRGALRGDQAFGARFALAQRRVLLGDEMGLGKTVQAIAAMAHLRAIDRTHFLVVCPASVLVNWTREVSARSRLRVHRLHGDDREAAAAAWSRHGGVGVTTFDALRALPADLPAPAMLVVDEAHYVKNPGAQRSAAVAAWAERAERVLFLTGTPLENRVGEFTALVSQLQPALVPAAAAAPGPHAFRRAVAPAYLRRNTEDVLGELPPLVRVEDWVELRAADADAYREAVAAGNFMAMRRAAYAPGHRAGSAKLDRLCDIVEEAAANARKVVVFSNFRDVLRVAAEAVAASCPVVGPVSGSVRAADRQALVDEFAGVAGGAVLVSQIQAGGVGLNMQAASVVVLCEPQLKPTIEDQAVARAHRMGQVRSVQVHRLLAADSVDERLLELLRAKTELFDDHARRSETAAAAPAALDVSDAELARRVVADEQRRLAVGPGGG